ncbi:hypothetical protein [Segetibacter sp. 3557_3]|nr:hypothetical protein [Segetibacter sp. 3557_3]
MKSIMKYLFYDQDVVETIQENDVNRDYLYNMLYSGRITLEEYVAGTK